MYKIISRKLRVISVNSNLTHVDTKLMLFPSEITNSWKKKKINLFNNKRILNFYILEDFEEKKEFTHLSKYLENKLKYSTYARR